MNEAGEAIDAHARLLADRMGRNLLEHAILHLNDEFWGMRDYATWGTHNLSDAICRLTALKRTLR
jgi:hypothetical protein